MNAVSIIEGTQSGFGRRGASRGTPGSPVGASLQTVDSSCEHSTGWCPPAPENACRQGDAAKALRWSREICRIL
jgi:hypothetical protein